MRPSVYVPHVLVLAAWLPLGCRGHEPAPNPAPQSQTTSAVSSAVAAAPASVVPASAPAVPPAALASTLHFADPRIEAQLVSGFFGIEGDWRWTAKSFAVKLGAPGGGSSKGGVLRLHFDLPPALVAKLHTVVVSAKIGSVEASKAFNTAGLQTLELEVPAAELGADSLVATFAVDKAYEPGGGDVRQLGVIAHSLELVAK
jgi:hypothetical protein